MNQQKIKVTNQQYILDLIHHEKEISRAEIAVRLGLNKATVSSQVSDLLEKQLLVETRIGVSSGGRRPVMLKINAQAGFVIGVEILIHKAICLVSDLDGVLVDTYIFDISSTDAMHYLETVCDKLNRIMTDLPPTTYGVVGISFAVPGILDKLGRLLLAPNLGWKNIDLKGWLSEKFPMPVYVLNEANAGAYNEKKVGLAIDASSFAYISIDSGIGVGIMLGDELYEGDGGFAGEDGHMIISIDGRDCLCGNKGCWETYASGEALLHEAAMRGLEKNINQLKTAACAGDAKALECFEAVGRYIGIGLSNITKTLNPEYVIIGGIFNDIREIIEPVIQRSLSTHQQWLDRKESLLRFSTEQHPAPKGAIRYAIRQFLIVD